MSVKRWVIFRKTDGKYWTAGLSKQQWMISADEAKPMTRKDAMQYSNQRRWGQKAIPVLVTIRPLKGGKR